MKLLSRPLAALSLAALALSGIVAGGPAAAVRPPELVSHKFDFGTGPVESGYLGVDATTLYSSTAGYGFAPPGITSPGINCVDRGAPTALLQDLCSSSTAFMVDLPQADYEVIVHSGDNDADNYTEVRAEGYRFAKTQSTTTAGTFDHKAFKVYVFDGRLELTFAGKTLDQPRINGIEVRQLPPERKGETPTVYLAGDSTVASYPRSVYPLTGWGQMLGSNFAPGVLFDNRAIGARSSSTFYLEGHLDRIMTDLRPQDYLLIQFGHNDKQSTDALCVIQPAYCDRKTSPYTSFKEYLQKYIDGARFHGATPVLVTPMGRRSYDSEGRFSNDFVDYAAAMKQLAVENYIPLIDLNTMSIDYYNQIGVEGTKEVFLYCEPGEYEAYPDGKEDNVHFQEFGATQLSIMVAQGIQQNRLPISRLVDRDELLPLPTSS